MLNKLRLRQEKGFLIKKTFTSLRETFFARISAFQ